MGLYKRFFKVCNKKMMILKILKLFRDVGTIFFGKNDEFLNVKFIEINSNLYEGGLNKTIPKKIWLYWDTINIPYSVNLCIDSIKKHCHDYEINLLNADTVVNYISLPDLSKEVLPAQKADLIRLELLAKYGGIWMDASIFLTQNLNWIFNKIENHDAFLFYSDECTLNIKKPISENWFIVAEKSNNFIKSWRDEFKKCITSDEPKRFYENIVSDKNLVQNLTSPEYLLCYLSAIVCLNKNKYKILYASSGSVGHFYNYKYNWSGYAVAIHLLLKDRNDIYIPPLIKFSSNSRKPIEKLIKLSIYNSKSILLDI